MFARWGRQPDENNRRQALLPAGSVKVTNPVGTAPCFILETGASTIISLPGVPRELKHLMENAALPYLRERLGAQPPVIKSRVLRTCSIGESNVDTLIGDLELLANPTVGLLAHPGQTDIRITAKATTEAEADAMIAPVEAEIRQRLGVFIYGVEAESLEEVVARLLRQQGKTVAIIESNTAGALADWLRKTRDASVLAAAQVAPDLLSLRSALPDIPADSAWPSAALASAAAHAFQRRAGADYALAIIGTMEAHETLYSGERGESYLALVHGGGQLARHFLLGGAGEVTQRWIGNRTLDLLRRVILGLATESVG